MKDKKLEVGTEVREVGTDRHGVVVPDLMGSCGSNVVIVDFDGVEGEQSCLVSELVVLEKIEVKFDLVKCAKCAFANAKCHRYDETRFGLLFSGRASRKIPMRIYPFCQEEMSTGGGQ